MTTLAAIFFIISFFNFFEGTVKEVTTEDAEIFDKTKLIVALVTLIIGIILLSL